MAISDIENVEPTELDPLYETVNPETLEHALAIADDDILNMEGSIEFEIDNYEVTIESSGKVRIRPE